MLKKMYEILQGIENLSLDIWLEEIVTLKRNILCQIDNEEHFVKGLCSENPSTVEWKCWKTIGEELFLQEKPKGTIYEVTHVNNKASFVHRFCVSLNFGLSKILQRKIST